MVPSPNGPAAIRTPNAPPARRPTRSPATAAPRFFRTPKGLLLLGLGLLTTVALLGVGVGQALPVVLSAMLGAALVDAALMILVRKELEFPGGALLTGLFVALVLSPSESVYVAGLTAALAVASKYVLRTRWSNIFNPAALGLVASSFLFGTAQSWWGALPTLPIVALLLVLGVGVFIADRVNKLPLALAYLGAFFGLFAITAALGNPAAVQEVFRSPDANAVLFLALFMLDDPPTSPVRYRDQVVFAALAALASFALYMTVGADYYLPAGILVANAWESCRRRATRGNAKAHAAKAGEPASQRRTVTPRRSVEMAS